ncbi:MAG TPA: outer membrane protein assembly factor BamD [Candidatus Avirikenella pullistercoris]|nr:outer membrane protein assembly factor BamD [Candidatus Avirikenella pullistercoris]
MRLLNIFLVISSLSIIVSCNGYANLLKGRDYQKQYTEALRYYNLQKDRRAIELFSNIENIFSGTDRIDTIKFYKAKAHYRERDYYSSVDLFDEFRKIYSRSPFAEEAEYLYAMSFYELAPDVELDQTNTANALAAFQEYVERYPESSKVEACLELENELQMRLYEKAFLIGETYYDIGYYNSAIHTFRNVLKNFPDIPQREQIMYYLVKANYQYAKASIEARQRERFYNTIDAYYNFVSQYPESKYMNEVERIYRNSERLSKGEEAIEHVSDELDLTEKRVARMEKKAMKWEDKVDDGRMTREKMNEKLNKFQMKIDKDKLKKAAREQRQSDRLNKKAAKEKESEEREQVSEVESIGTTENE